MSEVSELAMVLSPHRRKDFWRILSRSALLGVIGAVAGLVFIGVTEIGGDLYGPDNVGWFTGPSWWIAVAVGAGLLVGILRRAFGMPTEIPGLIEDLQEEHIDTRWVPSAVVVSAVSLIGGASLGPEVALGQIGGGAGSLLARRDKADEDDTKALTLSGMAGAFGGLFSSPLLSLILVTEAAEPPKRRFLRVFYGGLVASSVSFGLYFAVSGSVFLGIYEIPPYTFQEWHLLVGVGLGVSAALVSVVAVIVVRIAAVIFERLPGPRLLKPVVGGLVFGLVGFALPLTNFTGSAQLSTAVGEVGTLGVGFLIAVLIAKMVTFAASSASGFIGGPIFPILFMGGIAGMTVNAIAPGIPLGLSFSAMLAAVPGSIVSAPFTMVLLAALLTQIGALQTAPVLIAVGTAYLTITLIQMAVASRRGNAVEGP